ncbi:hypothetical protein BOTBODRAFT_77258, partial [Botryobasidium botryosum FD-172 SS1]
HNSKLTGEEWVQEQLDGPSHGFKDQFGMETPVFRRFVRALRQVGLDDSKFVSAEEQTCIFLHAIVTNLTT